MTEGPKKQETGGNKGSNGREDRLFRKRMMSPMSKVVVSAAFLLSVGLAVFGIVQLITLAGIGLTPYCASKGYAFEQTSFCGQMVEHHLADILNYYQNAGTFCSDGVYDGKKTFDFWKYTSGKDTGEAGDTVYTLEELNKLYQDGTAQELARCAQVANEEYASNDAGINKKWYLEYQEYGEDAFLKETEEPGEAEETAPENLSVITDVKETDPDLFSLSLEERKDIISGYRKAAPNNAVYDPSWEAKQSLREQGKDPDDYTSQFLYLYDMGMETEKIKTKAGTYLYQYALENPETVSLMDLYLALDEGSRAVAEFRNLDTDAWSGDSNLWYFLEDDEGNCFTNVEQWQSGKVDETSLKNSSLLSLAYENTNSLGKFRVLSDGESDAIEFLKEYLTNSELTEGWSRILVTLNPELVPSDMFYKYFKAYDSWRPFLIPLFGMTVIGIAGAVICLILAGLQAGKKAGREGLTLVFFDRWPLEISILADLTAAGLMIGILVLGFLAVYDTVDASMPFYQIKYVEIWRSLVISLSSVLAAGIFLTVYDSLVRQIKAKSLWQRSFLKKIVDLFRKIYGARKKSERLLLAFGGFCLLQIILLKGFGGFGVLTVILLDAVVLLGLLKEASGRQIIKDGLQEIASGDLDVQIDTKDLGGTNLEMAETVNSVGEGLKVAVQEQMKSERLKADLITNVSHDIKTPLTSIINYVDLLKREHLEDPRIQSYIEVLDAKSQRLKQLTEDLVEASKISSGNIKLEFMNLNLNELVCQVNGEFDERFQEKNLSLICKLSQEALIIRADSRRIWRVLENLYVNVCKYAMPGTRVYVEAGKKDGKVVFSMKNISENPLNFSGDELTERFIRGDVSRSTEGSGLGLSIAKNLTTLQHGTFQIYLDGDLFKVTLTFDEV